jgi:cell wall-associated NlpC family hydrolase
MIFLLVFLLLISPVYGQMTQEKIDCIKKRQNMRLDLNVPYLWGGASFDIEKGVDCSGAVFADFGACGEPVLRTTSFLMSRGEGNWNRYPEGSLSEAGILSLLFFTMKPERPKGHVGYISKDYKGKFGKFAQASSSSGFIESEIFPENYWYRRLVLIRLIYLKEKKK